jgi:spoIIIJ-associated protein
MKSIELAGRSVEEIRAAAAEALGVPEDQVQVEVLEEKRGLLGLFGGGEVRACATVIEPPAEPEPDGAPTAGPDEIPTTPMVEAEDLVLDDELARLANRAQQVSNEILRLMGLEVTARALEIGEDEIRLELTGDDIALVIGKHGDTLDALQLLVAIIANRDAEVTARIVLDAEQYRDRRQRALEATARTHAAKAKQTGREVVIRDLKAFERRIIHLVLRDDPEVETYSEGEGRQRNLVISPLTVSRSDAEDQAAGPDDEAPGE